MAIKATVENGAVQSVEIETPTFEECQKIVGGLVEIIRLEHGAVVLCNEDGIAMGLPMWTIRGTTETGWPMRIPVYGNAVMLNKVEADKVLGAE